MKSAGQGGNRKRFIARSFRATLVKSEFGLLSDGRGIIQTSRGASTIEVEVSNGEGNSIPVRSVGFEASNGYPQVKVCGHWGAIQIDPILRAIFVGGSSQLACLHRRNPILGDTNVKIVLAREEQSVGLEVRRGTNRGQDTSWRGGRHSFKVTNIAAIGNLEWEQVAGARTFARVFVIRHAETTFFPLACNSGGGKEGQSDRRDVKLHPVARCFVLFCFVIAVG
mmetsp:Transcript_33431/g.49500  ORF Transcript_33431/g.49500 Transcript_33431/m.49500 type:complete len:224 (-) Transcript_33431:542-1213(-)